MNLTRSVLMLVLSVSYLLHLFYPHVVFESVLIASCLITFLVSLFIIKGIARVTAMILVGLGTILFIHEGADFHDYMLAYASNAALLSVLILVPLINVPIRMGGYLDEISILYNHYLKNINYLYLLSTGLTYVLSIILNFAAVFIVYQLTDAERKQEIQAKVFRALQRGYPLSIYWSPYFVSVGMIISYFHVAWVEIFLVGFLLSLLNLLIGYRVEKEAPDPPGVPEPEHERDVRIPSDPEVVAKSWKKVRELIWIGVAITVLILAVEQFTDLTILSVVPIIVIISTILWPLYLGEFSQLKSEINKYIAMDLPRMKGEIALFVSAGFFGQAVLLAGFSNDVLHLLQYAGIDQAFPLSIVLFCSVIALSFIGIHPFVSVLTFCISLSGSELVVGSERFISMVLLASWPITTAVSPFSGMVLYISSFTAESPFRVGLKNNWRYCLYVTASTLAVLNIFHYAFGF